MEKPDKRTIQDILALTPLQEGILFHYLKEPASDHYVEQLVLILAGEIQPDHFKKAWAHVVQVNEALRTFFRWEKLEKPAQVVLKQHHPDMFFFDISALKDDTEKQNRFEEIKIEDRQRKFDLREVPFRVLLCKFSDRDYRMVISNHHILYDGWSTGIILKEFFQAYALLEKGGWQPQSIKDLTSESVKPSGEKQKIVFYPGFGSPLVNEEATPATGIKPPFSEFLRWYQSRERDKQKKFWEDYLQGFVTQTHLPIKRREVKPDHGGEGAAAEFHFVLEKGEKERLDDFLKERRVTLAAVFYCAWGILLQKYCDSNDVVFGTTVAGRSAPINGIENMVGLFINTIPLRITTEPGEKIKDLVRRINDLLAIREKYDSTSLVDIKGYSELQNNQELFESIVVLENYPLDRRFMQENTRLPLVVKSYSIIETTPYLLTVSITTGEAIEIRFIFDSLLFEDLALPRLAAHFNTILMSILEDFDKGIRCIELLTGEERQRILVDFNKTEVDYPRDKTLHQLYKEQVERTPDNLALHGCMIAWMRGEEGSITYKELNEKSNRLAYTLLNKGAQPDTIVGIMTERSVDMIIGILGILKAGGAYLPIDPDYPEERIKYTLSDSDAKILVTTGNLAKEGEKVRRWEGKKILLNEILEVIKSNAYPLTFLPSYLQNSSTPATGHRPPVTSLAYVIYTSGSTGKPKGVMIEHCAVINFIKGITDIIPFTGTDRILSLTTMSFDIFGLETLLPLTKGTGVIIGNREEQLEALAAARCLQREQITIFQVTPSRLQLLILAREFSLSLASLRYLLVGGEVFPTALLEKVKKITSGQIFNVYGPTETTIWSTIKEVTQTNSLDIGKPIANTRVYIVNREGSFQPLGIPGEIIIAGHGVARGYLNQPELTAEKFIMPSATRGSFEKPPLALVKLLFNYHSPFTFHHSPLYKTGDLARWMPDGNIEFLGRIDYQVKIRGFRIELGEIENQLLKSKSIKEAVVTVREDKDSEKYLCAYIVPHSANSFSSMELAETLRNYLLQFVPDYMVPSFFVLLDKIPLTANGKVDRHALPEPVGETGRKYTAPRNETEQTLTGIWAQLLHFQPGTVGIDDNFFHLGGHSLKAILLVSRIHKELDVNIPMGEIFRTPTIRGLSVYIKGRDKELYASIEPVEKKEYYPLSSAQERLYVLRQMDMSSTAYNISAVLSLKGSLDKNKLQDIFRKLIHRHESLRTSFEIIDTEPVQKIRDEVEFGIEYYNLATEDTSRPAAATKKMEPQITLITQINKKNVRKKMVRKILLQKHRYESVFICRLKFPCLKNKKFAYSITENTEVTNYNAPVQKKDRGRMTNYKQIPNPKSQITNKSEEVIHREKSPLGTKGLDTEMDQEPKSQELRAKSYIKNFIRPFDLAHAPLLRVGLIKTENYQHILMVDMHHIVSDGMSTQLLLQDFVALYTGEALSPLKVQYKDYAYWQKEEVEEQKLFQQKEYWQHTLAAELPVLELPLDFPRPTFQRFEGSLLYFELETSQTQALNVLARANGCTLFMVLLAVYDIFLSRLCGQEDILVGTPTAGRRHSDLETIMGMFVNTLVLRNFPCGEKPFPLFLAEVRKRVLQAFENQDYPYEDLVELAAVNRDTSRNPLFDTMLVVQDTGIPAVEIPGLELTPYPYQAQTSKFDLTLTAVELAVDRIIRFTLEYSTNLFKQESCQRFIGYFLQVLTIVLSNPGIRLAEIEILTAAEKQQLLYDFNETAVDYLSNKNLYELFTHQAAITPDHTALLYGSHHISYNRFQGMVAGLAHELRTRGVGSDTIVALLLERSIEMLVGIYAILCTGGVYLPIAADLPRERVQYILADSCTRLLLTTPTLAASNEEKRDVETESKSIHETVPGLENITIFLDTLIRNHLSDSSQWSTERPRSRQSRYPPPPQPVVSLVYIIYTSGSTGRPKGVMVEHTAAVNILTALQRSYPLTAGDSYLLKTSYMFDVSVAEIFGWFWAGGSIAILEKGSEKDPEKIMAAVQQHRITHINFVPSMFNAFCIALSGNNHQQSASLKYIFLAGEVLAPAVIERFRLLYPGIPLANIYGPTEGTIYACGYSLTQWAGQGNIPIGKPLANIRLYILNSYDRLQPPGIAGELCISGQGLARGYLNQPELTAEKFCHRPGGSFREDLYRHPAPRGLDPHKSFRLKKLDKDHMQSCNHAAMPPCSHAIMPLAPHHSHHSATHHPPLTIYRTGDLARWRIEGNIEFLGRLDHQVKIRGYRIEPGEIERKLLQHPDVKEALVLALENKAGDKYLCAYIIPKQSTSMSLSRNSLLSSGLREYLRRSLPVYMIPNYFVPLEQMPLSPTGKIARKALPLPVFRKDSEYMAPRDEIEQTLVEMWSEILGIKEDVIGIQANFFELGGHSLKAVLLANKIHKTFSVKVSLQELFQFPTITGMVYLIQKSKSNAFYEIEKQPEQVHYSLSYSQKRLWYIYKSEPNSGAFNIPAKITLYEAVSEKVIREVLEQLIVRHESLRTSFIEIDEKPRQVIGPFNQSKLSFEIIDASHLDKTGQEILRTRLMKDEASYVFNLEVGPLFKAKLVKWAAQEYDFIFNIHHIISDGWSMEILKQEFFQYYPAQKEGKICTFEPLRIQYKDYAAWQNQLLADETHMGQAKEFWKNYLSGTLPVLDLPYDFLPVPGGLSNKKSSAYGFVIGEEIKQGLQAYARSQHASLFMVLLAGFYILLSHITGQKEILLAIPAAARQHWELKAIVGMFVNTLVLRSQVNMDETFDNFFRSLQANSFDVLEYQAYPLELIFSELKMKYPEISVFFNMLNFGTSQMEQLTDLMSYHIEETQETKFKIQCYLTEYKNGIQVSCHYSRELFLSESIERIMTLFARILENISRHPDQKLKEYCISTNKKKVLSSLKKVLQKNSEEKVSSEFKISDDVKQSQQRLSEVNIMFLDYIEKNPACLKSANFRGLDLHDNLFRLQPWPTFIDTKTSVQFQEVGVKLFNLVKQIPRKVFNFNQQRMSTYYKISEEMLSLQMEGVTDEHIENLLCRGDFLLSNEGLKCLEYNVSPSLGGWQIPLWEALYLKTPILRRFLKEYGITTRNRNLLALFLEHIIRCSLGKVSPHESELNIALAIKGYEAGADQDSWMHPTGDYLNLLYKDILPQVDKSLKGQFILCNYKQLRLVDDCIFYEGKKIHGLTEGYNGVVSLEVMTAFKSGNLSLFNGPISHLLSNKLNLALLSDPETNAVFTNEEREVIATYVPWSRKTIAGTTTYRGETIKDLEHFMLSHQERLVLKPSSGYGGKGIWVGNKTPPDQWEEAVKNAIQEENWVVQEFVESCPGVYQVGEGYDYHDMAWGFFVFGSQYTGAWVRVMPKVSNKGVINCHQGASVSIIFEVDQKVEFERNELK